MGEIRALSSTWTGRSRPLRLPHPRAFFWWLSVGLRKTLCPHVWDHHAARCDTCGVTQCDVEDHTWRYIPTRRANSVLMLRGRFYRGFDI